MDFARKILGKYGWKDGDGLGKNNNGIAKPLRATLKFDNAGLGADQAATDFNNHWWERVFNDAASNVKVNQDGEGVKMDLIDNEDGVEITTKGYSMKKLKAKRNKSSMAEPKSEGTYNNFLQAATLTNTGDEIVNPGRIEAGDIEVTKVKVLTDEELFKACGGRTAHKGARHGLKLSGKLARLEKQEEEMLAKMLAKQYDVEEHGKKKMLKQKTKEETEATNESIDVAPIDESEKRKKKKTKRKITLESTFESVLPITEDFQKERSKKKKRKKNRTEDVCHETETPECDVNDSTTVSKSKRRKENNLESSIPELTLKLDEKPEKKKNKCAVEETVKEIPNVTKKNKKCKKKSKSKTYQE